MSRIQVRVMIEGTITDLVADFLYYDRKEDKDLPLGRIEMAIEEKQITTDEIVEMFAIELRKALT